MKTVLAATLAGLLGAGSLAAIGTETASAAAVVVRVGPHHHYNHWHGNRWMWHGRYWYHRGWNCRAWHHRRACAWRYW